MSEPKRCFSACNKFRCGKNVLQFRGRVVWCRWTEEPCNPMNCTYALCVNRRLLPGGVCGETIRRKTIEKRIDEESNLTVKVRGKTFRKIGEKEIF